MEWKQIDYQLRDVLIDSLLKSKILDRIKFHRNENDRFHDRFLLIQLFRRLLRRLREKSKLGPLIARVLENDYNG